MFGNVVASSRAGNSTSTFLIRDYQSIDLESLSSDFSVGKSSQFVNVDNVGILLLGRRSDEFDLNGSARPRFNPIRIRTGTPVFDRFFFGVVLRL